MFDSIAPATPSLLLTFAHSTGRTMGVWVAWVLVLTLFLCSCLARMPVLGPVYHFGIK